MGLEKKAKKGWSAADDVAAGRRVLELEAEGLRALSLALDGAFSEAVDILGRIKGRIIVSGMGKSGHVGSKIAATLASTGSAAFFVHPAEASHGDLGMITIEDAVIAISNSGESKELADVVAYTRRFAIPLIAITRRGTSTLGEAADVTLLLPDVAEACPLGLAPTTSTTATLALGDALAVALLERKGFSAQDFQVFHPGGKLGQTLQRVEDLMHGDGELPLISTQATMSTALIEMTAKRFGCVGVVGNGKLAGVITDGDLRRHMAANLLDRTVIDVMTKAPKIIGPSALAAEALRIMNTNQVTCLFVVEDGAPVGILHIHDLLRAGVA
ncbi:MAG: D-arabinose 5-phosphate [Alphaproteobacteria bacterium RIFOXYD12_FULL_60_8]|nr:MAG: D-arabinose 5-phosphate [Alphaproteobacteria bacterium RIFOXYD12_FULL_60_8]